jgi:hypothetical protein
MISSPSFRRHMRKPPLIAAILFTYQKEGGNGAFALEIR